MMGTRDAILTINCGSSSVKFALFTAENEPWRLFKGAVARIGLPDGQLRFEDSGSATLVDEIVIARDHERSLMLVLETVGRHAKGLNLVGVGHRVVHGGPDCDCPLAINAPLLARLDRLVPLAPLHLPHNLAGIAAVRRARPDLPQFACFDTAFHQNLPRLARLTALPRALEQEEIRRYGFHGLSYEYVLDELRRRDGEQKAGERLVVAHLGNGASMAAIRGGRSVETTMGFSTLGGLPMGTRSGDLDPGIILYLLTEKGMTVEGVVRLLYEESGLLGLSGISSNMQDLLVRTDDPAATEAVEFFCYQARKHLGSLAAALGGLDRIVFTGGIGANAPSVRAKICENLEHLSIALDETRNQRGNGAISAARSRVRVEAFPTDEELMIARHVRGLLAAHPVAREA